MPTPRKPQRKSSTVIAAPDSGLVERIIRHIKLTWYLMGDRRVPFLLKVLPVLAVLYWINPWDPLPCIGMTPADDLTILSAAITFFVKWAPKDVVKFYEDLIDGRVTRIRGTRVEVDIDPEDIVEGDFRPADEPGTDEGSRNQEEYDWSQHA